ncbi:MAG: hypothetical protein IKB97_06115 [Bacteroidaceae bacterium]|nr:hypothetical protein [Bacteroidaceae bacterium]
MIDYVVHENIKYDICGNAMGFETNGVTSHDTLLPNDTYCNGVVKVSAFYLGTEKTCQCNDCRKAILKNALESLG